MLDTDELPHWRTLRLEDDGRLRILGIIALIVAVLPSNYGAHKTLWPWDILAAAPTLDETLSVLSPAILGVALWAVTFVKGWTRLGVGLFSFVLLGLAISYTATSKASAAALFGDGVLAFVARDPLMLTLGLSVLAAGADLQVRFGRNQVTRAFLVGGAAILGLFYVFPVDGQTFFGELADRLSLMDNGVFVLSMVLSTLFSLVPLGLMSWGLWTTYGKIEPGLLGGAARYALPILSMALAYRMVMGGQGGSAILVFARAALLLAVGVGVASRCLEMITSHLWFDPLPPGDERSDLARDVALRSALKEAVEDDPTATAVDVAATRTGSRLAWPVRVLMQRRVEELSEEGERPREAMLAVLTAGSDAPEPTGAPHWLVQGQVRIWAALGLLVLGFFVLTTARHWRPTPDLAWELRAATKSERKLFARDIPGMLLKLGQRNMVRFRGQSAAELSTELREQRREVLAAAREIAPDLRDALDALFRSTDASDMAGRAFHRRVTAVNKAIRRAGLPFWLDSFGFGSSRFRAFYVVTYEVDRIRRFDHDGDPYAALHVKRIDRLNIGGSLLGFVMPDEPFALILVEEIAGSAKRRVDALASDGTCGMFSDFMVSDAGRTVDQICGRVLARVLAKSKLSVAVDEAAVRKRVGEVSLLQTEIHELQHQVDGEGLPVPVALKKMAPGVSYEDLHRAAKELSAHTTELAIEDPDGLVLSLAHLSSALLSGNGGKYAYAAGVIFNGLTGNDKAVEQHLTIDEFAIVDFWKELEKNADDVVGFVTPKGRALRDELFGDEPALPVVQP